MSVPDAGGVAVNVAANVSVYVPLLAFLAVIDVNMVVPFSTTDVGAVQVTFAASGETLQLSVKGPTKPSIGVMVTL